MDLLTRLKEFYLLEAFQVQLYQSWLDSAQDEYTRTVYEQMVVSEQKHVDFFKEKLLERGEEEPVISGGLTALAGRIWGEVLDLSGTSNQYKMGIFAENKALEMYRVLILEAFDQPELCKDIYRNMVDEEYHLLWFKEHMPN